MSATIINHLDESRDKRFIELQKKLKYNPEMQNYLLLTIADRLSEISWAIRDE